MLADGFVYLSKFAPNIQQSVRYATNHNFVGRPVSGYLAEEIVLSEKAAEALAYAEEEMNKSGLSIVVYDGYRPQKAVEYFYQWSLDSLDQQMKSTYYPNIDKKDLFDLGFISRRSAHTRGGAVDITLIELGKKIHDVIESETILRDGSLIPFLDDGTINFGSSFDLFHPVSFHHTDLVIPFYLDHRNFLRNCMEKHGFVPYRKEWWHYSLREEQFGDTYFDFDIE